MKNVLHILAGGGTGGIEVLCEEFALGSVHRNVFLILWESGAISQEMRDNGIEVVELKVKKSVPLAAVRGIEEVVKRCSIDTLVVHHASPIAHIYMQLVKMRNPKLHTIAYSHGLAGVMCRENEKKGLTFRKAAFRFSLKKSDIIVAVSEASKNSMVEMFHADADKIRVIYNGVDTKRFSRAASSEAGANTEIIYVGRLIEGKGVQITLQALARIKESVDYHFTVVGDGGYREELELLTETLGLRRRVTFVGSRRDVPQLLQKAGVFIHVPTLEEGFGITIIEAMASGLICICSDSGAIGEIINDKKDGFLVRKNDEKALADCILHVAAMTEDERERVRSAAVTRADDFSSEKFISQLDEVIEGL